MYVLCYRNAPRAGRLPPLAPLLELARHGHRKPPTGATPKTALLGFGLGPIGRLRLAVLALGAVVLLLLT